MLWVLFSLKYSIQLYFSSSFRIEKVLKLDQTSQYFFVHIPLNLRVTKNKNGENISQTAFRTIFQRFYQCWPNFSPIVYIAVRIHVMFMLNLPNLQRVKIDYFMFHFMLFCIARFFPGPRNHTERGPPQLFNLQPLFQESVKKWSQKSGSAKSDSFSGQPLFLDQKQIQVYRTTFLEQYFWNKISQKLQKPRVQNKRSPVLFQRGF